MVFLLAPMHGLSHAILQGFIVLFAFLLPVVLSAQPA